MRHSSHPTYCHQSVNREVSPDCYINLINSLSVNSADCHQSVNRKANPAYCTNLVNYLHVEGKFIKLY